MSSRAIVGDPQEPATAQGDVAVELRFNGRHYVEINEVLHIINGRLNQLEEGVFKEWNVKEMTHTVLKMTNKVYDMEGGKSMYVENVTERKGFHGLPKWNGSLNSKMYETLKFAITNFLNGVDPIFKVVLKWIEKQTEDITYDTLKEFAAEKIYLIGGNGREHRGPGRGRRGEARNVVMDGATSIFFACKKDGGHSSRHGTST